MQETAETVWEDLLVSMMAVNNYSLEKAFAHLGGLRAEGLVEPKNLISWTSEEIAARLGVAGFNRGSFMNAQMAQRITSLARFLESKGIVGCEAVLTSGNPSAIQSLLLPVHGIGQRVIEN